METPNLIMQGVLNKFFDAASEQLRLYFNSPFGRKFSELGKTLEKFLNPIPRIAIHSFDSFLDVLIRWKKEQQILLEHHISSRRTKSVSRSMFSRTPSKQDPIYHKSPSMFKKVMRKQQSTEMISLFIDYLFGTALSAMISKSKTIDDVTSERIILLYEEDIPCFSSDLLQAERALHDYDNVVETMNLYKGIIQSISVHSLRVFTEISIEHLEHHMFHPKRRRQKPPSIQLLTLISFIKLDPTLNCSAKLVLKLKSLIDNVTLKEYRGFLIRTLSTILESVNFYAVSSQWRITIKEVYELAQTLVRKKLKKFPSSGWLLMSSVSCMDRGTIIDSIEGNVSMVTRLIRYRVSRDIGLYSLLSFLRTLLNFRSEDATSVSISQTLLIMTDKIFPMAKRKSYQGNTNLILDLMSKLIIVLSQWDINHALEIILFNLGDGRQPERVILAVRALNGIEHISEAILRKIKSHLSTILSLPIISELTPKSLEMEMLRTIVKSIYLPTDSISILCKFTSHINLDLAMEAIDALRRMMRNCPTFQNQIITSFIEYLTDQNTTHSEVIRDTLINLISLLKFVTRPIELTNIEAEIIGFLGSTYTEIRKVAYDALIALNGRLIPIVNKYQKEVIVGTHWHPTSMLPPSDLTNSRFSEIATYPRLTPPPEDKTSTLLEIIDDDLRFIWCMCQILVKTVDIEPALTSTLFTVLLERSSKLRVTAYTTNSLLRKFGKMKRTHREWRNLMSMVFAVSLEQEGLEKRRALTISSTEDLRKRTMQGHQVDAIIRRALFMMQSITKVQTEGAVFSLCQLHPKSIQSFFKIVEGMIKTSNLRFIQCVYTCARVLYPKAPCKEALPLLNSGMSIISRIDRGFKLLKLRYDLALMYFDMRRNESLNPEINQQIFEFFLPLTNISQSGTLRRQKDGRMIRQFLSKNTDGQRNIQLQIENYKSRMSNSEFACTLAIATSVKGKIWGDPCQQIYPLINIMLRNSSRDYYKNLGFLMCKNILKYNWSEFTNYLEFTSSPNIEKSFGWCLAIIELLDTVPEKLNISEWFFLIFQFSSPISDISKRVELFVKKFESIPKDLLSNESIRLSESIPITNVFGMITEMSSMFWRLESERRAQLFEASIRGIENSVLSISIIETRIQILLEIIVPWMKRVEYKSERVKSVREFRQILMFLVRVMMKRIDIDLSKVWKSISFKTESLRGIVRFLISNGLGTLDNEYISVAKRIMSYIMRDIVIELLFSEATLLDIRGFPDRNEVIKEISIGKVQIFDEYLLIKKDLVTIFATVITDEFPIVRAIHLSIIGLDNRIELVKQHAIRLLENIIIKLGINIEIPEIKWGEKNSEKKINKLVNSIIIEKNSGIENNDFKNEWISECFRWLLPLDSEIKTETEIQTMSRTYQIIRSLTKTLPEDLLIPLISDCSILVHGSLNSENEVKLRVSFVLMELLITIEHLSKYQINENIFLVALGFLDSKYFVVYNMAIKIIKNQLIDKSTMKKLLLNFGKKKRGIPRKILRGYTYPEVSNEDLYYILIILSNYKKFNIEDSLTLSIGLLSHYCDKFSKTLESLIIKQLSLYKEMEEFIQALENQDNNMFDILLLILDSYKLSIPFFTNSMNIILNGTLENRNREIKITKQLFLNTSFSLAFGEEEYYLNEQDINKFIILASDTSLDSDIIKLLDFLTGSFKFEERRFDYPKSDIFEEVHERYRIEKIIPKTNSIIQDEFKFFDGLENFPIILPSEENEFVSGRKVIQSLSKRGYSETLKLKVNKNKHELRLEERAEEDETSSESTRMSIENLIQGISITPMTEPNDSSDISQDSDLSDSLSSLNDEENLSVYSLSSSSESESSSWAVPRTLVVTNDELMVSDSAEWEEVTPSFEF